MILEHLITAYLDGELTPEQDRELRQNLAADPSAREAFDAAVLIHIALRCEDRTMPPPGLRSSVFDAIDMIAAEEDRVAATSGLAKRPIRVGNRGVTILACLLLLFYVPVTDQYRQIASELDSYTASEPESYTARELESYSAKKIDSNESDQLTSSLADSNVDDHTSAPAHQHTSTPAHQLPLATLMGGHPVVSERNVASDSPLPTEIIESLPVHVSTAYAAGMASTVPGAADVRQISASLAYGVSERASVGLEVGSTSYSMTRTVTLMTGHAARSSAKPVGVTDGGKLSSPGPSGADYQASLATMQTSEQQMWATAFYEHKLFSINDLSINGRLAAGVAEDGLLGYGRLMGEWKLGSVASIIAGAEARTMPFRSAGTSGTTTYGSVVTLLTGIHFRF